MLSRTAGLGVDHDSYLYAARDLTACAKWSVQSFDLLIALLFQSKKSDAKLDCVW